MLSQLASLKLPQFERKNLNLNFRSMRTHFLPNARKFLGQTAHFLKTCYIDGFRALLLGKFNQRQAILIIVATIPILLSVGMLFIPTVLFPTPQHQAFYHFAQTLAGDSISMIPVVIGAVSTTLGLKIPLG
ncbi:hypothetical protein [Haloferula rosea]|nr:hypothetical protein [Haloferula rosea]